ncbi:hypothetical protein [Celeribacter sp. HF31]|uniref:hypothetical protein n=1 Tax=Celeribacter sp. HF31 TaxID=2721558 RepID=UPI00143024DC|nr:hypothetical protein [Celeribacter sp. HF31]
MKMESVHMNDRAGLAWINWFPPLAVCAVGLFSTAWMTFFAGVGVAGEPVALVFPPNWDRSNVFLGAASLNVHIVDVDSNGTFAVVIPRTDDALDRFRTSGALLALNSVARTLCR